MSSSTDREENISPEEVAKKVKDLAKIIRETSSTARETVRKFHESGAISELADTFRYSVNG
jgi:predicted metal-binding transcription factor (methanogenesis marker protein 9)